MLEILTVGDYLFIRSDSGDEAYYFPLRKVAIGCVDSTIKFYSNGTVFSFMVNRFGPKATIKEIIRELHANIYTAAI